MMPEGGGEARGAALATLRVLIHEGESDPALGEVIARAEREREAGKLGAWQAANLREIRRRWEQESALPAERIENVIADALERAGRDQIRGKEITPYLLRAVGEATGGASIEANLALLVNNVSVAADVAEGPDFERMVQEALDAFGRLDIVVNNAGITHPNTSLLEVDEATYDRVFAVNVKSIYWSARHAVPVFRRQGGGCFVNIASTAGLRPRPGLTWYNGTKGAVIIISKSMAVELAPDKIRVNAICPVIGETGLTAAFMGGDTPELRAKFVGTIPLGRMSLPKDVAAAALFLASDEAEFFTGVALEVDGGRCV